MTTAITPIPMNHFKPEPATQRAYRDALGKFVTGITVITIDTEKGPAGFTANSFSSVSLEPPLILWSLAKQSNRYSLFAHAEHMAIHVLSTHQQTLSNRFARGDSTFDGLNWNRNANGVPLLDGCLARFECHHYANFEAGDHDIIVCQVDKVSMCNGDPLVYAGGQYAALENAHNYEMGTHKQAS